MPSSTSIVIVNSGMRNGVARKPAAQCQKPSTYEVGLWQEQIIWDITKNVLETNLGTFEVQKVDDINVRQTLSWGHEGNIYNLTWYKPNTHPMTARSISKPEFGIAKNGIHLIIIESKNWNPYYKYLSLWQVERQIITRFRYIPAPNNILVITDLRVEPTASGQVCNLFADYNVNTIILTHRQATSSHDAKSQHTINETLPPVLNEILKLGPYQTPQNEARSPIW